VSAKLDELAAAPPPERESHLGETEHDADYEEPAAKSSKPKEAAGSVAASEPDSAAAAQPTKSAGSAARKAAKDDKGDESNDYWGKSAEGITDEEEDRKQKLHVGQDDSLLDDRLSWPKRPPRRK